MQVTKSVGPPPVCFKRRAYVFAAAFIDADAVTNAGVTEVVVSVVISVLSVRLYSCSVAVTLLLVDSMRASNVTVDPA